MGAKKNDLCNSGFKKIRNIFASNDKIASEVRR